MMHGFPYLSVLTLAPLVGALVGGASCRGARPQLAKVVAFVWSLAVLGVGIAMWVAFQAGGARFQFRESYQWIPFWGARIHAAGRRHRAGDDPADRRPRTAGDPRLLARRARRAQRSVPAYFALLLALEFTMIGVFAAADVFLFYVFFEVMLVPMYFLIGSYGGARRQYAAVKFFLYSLVGGLLMLAAVIGLWVVGAQPARPRHVRLAAAHHAAHVHQRRSAGCSSASSSRSRSRRRSSRSTPGCRTPVARRRPVPAALLVGVLDKVGTFGILRYCLPLFPHASRYFAPLGLALALVGIIYGALLAVGQNDLKRLVVVHVDRALRLHRHRHLRVHHPGRHRRGALHAQPRPRHRPAVPGRRHAGHPARLGAGRRLRRRRQAACRCWPACSSSPVSRRWRCRARRRSSASSWC